MRFDRGNGKEGGGEKGERVRPAALHTEHCLFRSVWRVFLAEFSRERTYLGSVSV